jgi:hypothetical protein
VLHIPIPFHPILELCFISCFLIVTALPSQVFLLIVILRLLILLLQDNLLLYP